MIMLRKSAPTANENYSKESSNRRGVMMGVSNSVCFRPSNRMSVQIRNSTTTTTFLGTTGCGEQRQKNLFPGACEWKNVHRKHPKADLRNKKESTAVVHRLSFSHRQDIYSFCFQVFFFSLTSFTAQSLCFSILFWIFYTVSF